MSNSGTHATNTLKEIRRYIMADSTLFGERLKPETAMPDTAGYSDLFMEARAWRCSSDDDRADSDSADAGASTAIRLAIEYIFEGYLLHYGKSRLLGQDDGNFNLLAGDYMYARGLEAIARLEDLASVEALAELVRLCSYIHCEQLDPGLAAKVWAVTTLNLAARMSSIDRDAMGAASVSGGGATPISTMPPFTELDTLDARLNELMAAPGLRELSSNIEAEFFHGN